jgi:hypothetical protein
MEALVISLLLSVYAKSALFVKRISVSGCSFTFRKNMIKKRDGTGNNNGTIKPA